MIVKESISFKRGQGSKGSLGLGEYREHLPPFDSVNSPGYYMVKSKSAFDGTWFALIQIVEDKDNHELYGNFASTWHALPSRAIRHKNMDPNLMSFKNPQYMKLNDLMDRAVQTDSISMKKIDDINELMKFDRDLSPKKSLNIGRYKKIYPPFDNIQPGFYIVKKENSLGDWYIIINVLESNKFIFMCAWSLYENIMGVWKKGFKSKLISRQMDNPWEAQELPKDLYYLNNIVDAAWIKKLEGDPIIN